jgi:putative transposase
MVACLHDHRQLYNAALQERRDAYQHPSRTTVRYGDQSVQLKDIRRADPDGQGRWSFSSQQATLRRLGKAFDGFFRRIRAGATPGYPRFKGARRFDTVEWPKDGDGCRWDSGPDGQATRVYLRGIGHVRVHKHRPVDGRVKTISVKRQGRRWFVVLSCDEVPAKPLPSSGRSVGIDMGVAHFATTSDGQHIRNPRFLEASSGALVAAQQHLSKFGKRVERRSKRHRAAAARVARLHGKIARQRADHAHKTALAMVRAYDVIAHERLNIAGMTRRPKPLPGPGTLGGFAPSGAAAKTGLNRSIMDAGWRQFLRILAGKAESAGRLVIEVDARNTSRTCPPPLGGCGHANAGNRVSQAEFVCVACGFIANADVVGAVNVLDRAGLALCSAAGAALQETRRSMAGGVTSLWCRSGNSAPTVRGAHE